MQKPMTKKPSTPGWDIQSWRKLPIKQQPDYKDPKKLTAVETALSRRYAESFKARAPR